MITECVFCEIMAGRAPGDIVYQDATYDGLEARYFQVYKDLIKNTWLAPSAGT